MLQECAAIFRLFTADAVSPAGSHTNTVPLSADLVSSTAEVKGNHTGQSYTNTYFLRLFPVLKLIFWFCTALYSSLRLP